MFTSKYLTIISAIVVLIHSSLNAGEFTISSFNCGGMPGHYDYIRAVCTQKLIQERYNTEPEQLTQADRAQELALKLLFTKDPIEYQKACEEWEFGNYDEVISKLTSPPYEAGSINKIWREKFEEMLTPYNVRPVVVYDEQVNEVIQDHARDLLRKQNISFETENSINEQLDIARRVMTKRIFKHLLKYDIIALQEADCIDASMLPQDYEIRMSNKNYSLDAVAWNKNKFELVDQSETTTGGGFVVELRDIETDQKIAVASGHIAGCNPFNVELDEHTGKLDSTKGDNELHELIEILDDSDATIKAIAMDSNVTPFHPRLSMLKESGYNLDYLNYLEPTCTSPWQIINTRIDWIAVKSLDAPFTIHNIPVMGVNLNSPQTNMSDHKPIAAKVKY